ncbi:XRE family transcriptional regulator [Novosphingobium sp. PS1R-30]|uniref:XRE family transcriptional regulator n=1 Tax=Novosphingobium anseongense TaxID=3133436 RepID=A0ABU8S2U1_9SPHN|nr:XRE family transcriptional regulator [Novosphingobium sp. JCM 18896]MCW1432088.1 XRE family transcriptional regulator [Novosphingobium sp. JCM 18896]
MPETIGALLRTLRKRRKMTLDRLSELTGISPSSLSRIENTQLGLTLEKVELLAKALEIAPEDLISRNQEAIEPSLAEPSPSRNNGSRRLMVDRERTRKASAYRELNTKYLFDPDAERALECMQCTIQSISVWDSEFVRHPGEKIIYVLRGDLVVYCEGQPPLILETGDAVFMDANVWHSTVAVHGQPAELLVTYYHGPQAREGVFETQTFTPESWAAIQED